MLVSLEWLRSLCPLEQSVERIALALTSRGLTVDAITPSGDDHVFDVDVPANRPDCLGHLGLARELAAAFAAPLAQQPEPPAGCATTDEIRIEIAEPELCRRFTARLLRGVRIEPSPPWVARRLEACGMRSINNAVDISNLVLLETGNPIHFYDYARVRGGLLCARRAGKGEPLLTIDDVERTLDPEMLVIADAERAVGVAGVMGGLETEISGSTREILVEAAWFAPGSIRTTARKLGLHTEASHRFERGADPDGVLRAQELAARLLEQLAGARVDAPLVDVYPAPASARTLTLREDQLMRLLGYRPETPAVEAALRSLQLSPRPTAAGRVDVLVPSWRMDLEREADLVEEVARHVGYDAIPTVSMEIESGDDVSSGSDLEEPARDRLAHLGFHEAIGYAMIGRGEDEGFLVEQADQAIALTRPIAESLACLRRSLLPGLLQAADLNARRGVRDVRLFEIGRVFLPAGNGEFPDERLHAGLAWVGAGAPAHFSNDSADVDLFDVSGVVEQLIDSLRPAAPLERGEAAIEALHPGRSLEWRIQGGDRVAWAGALHPQLRTKRSAETFLAEIDLSTLARSPHRTASYAGVPKLNSVSRDLALVMDGKVPFARVHQALRAVESPAPAEFQAVDRYTGPPLEEGQSSLTLRVTLQPLDRTLTEAEIESYRHALVAVLKDDLDLEIRS